MQSVTVNSSVARTRTPGSVIGGALGKMGTVFSAHKSAQPPPLPATAGTPTNKPEEAKLTPERKVLESKLHPSLLEAFDCVAKKQQGCKLEHDGKVEVQVWLTKLAPDILEKLHAAGFEVASGHTTGTVLVGKLNIEKIEALAQIAEVKFVSPLRK